MLGKQAKILSRKNVRRLLIEAGRGRMPERDRLMVLLAIYAGLRAAEIAQLTWGMVLDAHGGIAATIDVRDRIAKRGTGRRVPLHPRLKTALMAWCQRHFESDPGLPLSAT